MYQVQERVSSAMVFHAELTMTQEIGCRRQPCRAVLSISQGELEGWRCLSNII